MNQENHLIDPIQEEINRIFPSDLKQLFNNRDGAIRLLETLKSKYNPSQIVTTESVPKEQRIWELSGLYYSSKNRFHEAIRIFLGLYEHMLRWQQANNNWTHKGMPLVWISDCYYNLGFIVHSKRYMMLTLVEDSIREQGKITPDTGGVYFRLVWKFGMSDYDLNNYAIKIFEIYNASNLGLFPEHIIQEVDNNWIIEFPSFQEYSSYIVNHIYIDRLMSELGDGSGKILEKLAAYLMQCMPGCKTNIRLRQKGNTTDYDVVCSMEGFILDFRSEFGRYFVCECKDWDKPVDFSTMAKLCRIVDSTKCKFGVLFSKNGISGEGENVYAEREQRKVFQDSGIIITVIDLDDIKNISNGQNIINLIRNKYERIRLDLK